MMRDFEGSLQRFGEFLLRARMVREQAAPHCVRWVRRFLARDATDESLVDQVRRFCDDLERGGRCKDWQVRQAEQALRMYYFLERADWHRPGAARPALFAGRESSAGARRPPRGLGNTGPF